MQGNETKHTIAFRESKLQPEENVIGFLEGWIGEMMGSGDKAQHNGEFMLTDIRACFYRKGLFGEVFKAIPLQNITTIETLSRMGYRSLTIRTLYEELAFKTFESEDEFNRIYSYIESYIKTNDNPSKSNSSVMSIPDQIRQLAELRDAGIITENEFAEKKTELLKKM